MFYWFFFFFQAEDGIRDHAQSRGLGDVYKRQGSVPRVPSIGLMNSVQGTRSLQSGRFTYSDICGSMLACNSPQLNAACHVLHRFLAPRHPPVSYTHLTLPTICSVQISVVAVSLKKKQQHHVNTKHQSKCETKKKNHRLTSKIQATQSTT
eukprot:TRINITY_DN5251_c0_g1_i2.p2 TRINITY_DN5251_c0_g1~~TRINITY_DN5251_c0_g1_i2.p2  ORF type:complete len:151 (+),score=14.53 TRINITY_DN5251_c0_g1_i2:57-509(+)